MRDIATCTLSHIRELFASAQTNGDIYASKFIELTRGIKLNSLLDSKLLHFLVQRQLSIDV